MATTLAPNAPPAFLAIFSVGLLLCECVSLLCKFEIRVWAQVGVIRQWRESLPGLLGHVRLC